MHLNGNIRHLLDKGRLSVNRLANIVGMHQPTLFRILGHPGKKPRTKTIKPIADLLGVSTTDLLHTDLKAQIENVITKNPFGFNNKITQPKQAPVAHTLNCLCGAVWDVRSDGVEEMVHAPTPPQRPWVGLTDEEIKEIIDKYTIDDHGFDIWCDGLGVVRAVDDKLRSKNT